MRLGISPRFDEFVKYRLAELKLDQGQSPAK